MLLSVVLNVVVVMEWLLEILNMCGTYLLCPWFFLPAKMYTKLTLSSNYIACIPCAFLTHYDPVFELVVLLEQCKLTFCCHGGNGWWLLIYSASEILFTDPYQLQTQKSVNNMAWI